jgi:hypothetical protein
MIIIANNMTETKADGTSDYDVKIVLANGKVIAHFEVNNHLRTDPASFLIHRIADELIKQQALLKATAVVN